MPIYEYRCSSCGHQQEFLQKLSDPPQTRCTKCGQDTFTKLVTAAGFQLKGSGWYATDFKGGAKPAAKTEGGDSKPGGDKSGGDKSGSEKSGGDKSGGEKKSEGAPSAAPALGTGASPAGQ